MTVPQDTLSFVPETVLKRDIFSETIAGQDGSGRRLAMRRLSGLPWQTRWLAWALARREIRGLRQVQGITGVPQLLRVDRDGILRTWSDGTPLHLARPKDPAWFRDARRLLRDMRRRGVAHNDLAKPQNWLATPDGLAAVIDFQLATVHGKRGALFRALAYEDLRHLLKQKRTYARDHLTSTEKRILARRALPSRIWMATVKPIYNFVTRRLMNWSDGEGTENRVSQEGPAMRAALLARAEIRDVALIAYSKPARGVGLYAFVETDKQVEAIRRFMPMPGPDLVHCTPTLPRGPDGRVREDLLTLIATNRVEEARANAGSAGRTVALLIEGRLNYGDRQL